MKTIEMKIIQPFELTGTVEAVLCAYTPYTHISTEVEKIKVFIREGVKGDNHSGKRLADVREKDFIIFGLPKGAEIANHREFSAISVEEMTELAQQMDIPTIPSGYLGENLIISGIPNFTMLPIGTKLFFKKSNQLRTAVLITSGENTPCTIPGKAIKEYYKDVPQNLDKLFAKLALGKRGVVGSIFSSGNIGKGDTIIAKVPRQYIYSTEVENCG